jgi:predicted HicB family RNase H-like nuclease
MSPSEEPDSEVRVTLRMPASVHQQARATADRERRSLNNMLVVLIERGLDHEADQKEGSG